jgi:hypothetical protein
MLSPSFSISPKDLWNAIATRSAPQIVDVRRRDAYEESPQLLPGAIWRDAAQTGQWMSDLDPARPIAVACKAGHEMSQSAVAQLRIACLWLIRCFLDPQARILFVDPDEVANVARESGGVPFDIKDVELSHVGERCSFDTMLRIFGLEGEPSLARLALIVRGADTARYDIAEEAAGLHAVSLGLSALAGDDDHGLLDRGFIVYDALFAWLRFAAEERHNWPAKAA